jgi:hypothetical protein
MQANIDRLTDEARCLEGEVSQKEALIVAIKGRMQSHAHALQVEYQIVAILLSSARRHGEQSHHLNDAGALEVVVA